MSRAQRFILCIGLILLATTAMFPPSFGYFPGGSFEYRYSAGRSFLLIPPSPKTLIHLPGGRPHGIQLHDVERDIGLMLGEWMAIASLTGFAVITVPYLLSVPSSLVARSRRRRGLCLKCGYDLTGNVSGVCPECGTSTMES